MKKDVIVSAMKQTKLPKEIQDLCVSIDDYDEGGLKDEAKVRICKQLCLDIAKERLKATDDAERINPL